MKRYPEYKESGVEWIGEIPKDWEIKKIKYMQSNLIGGVWGNEPEGNENDIYCVRVADFNYVQLAISMHNLTLRNIPLTERDKRILRTDDLLVEKSGGGEKSPVGRTVIFDVRIPRRSVTSNFISKFTAKSDSCFPRYLLYCLSFLYQIGLTRKHIKQSTGLQNLDIDSYFQERISFPSLIEQNKIANFLDRKTGQIDELIRIKARRIELLQEQRTALINQAVTKGLDPNVEMKPSGVEWIGEIPKNWEVKKIKYTQSDLVGGVWGDEPEGNENDIYCIRVADFNYVQLTISTHNLTERNIPLKGIDKRILRTDDLLIEKSGGGEKSPVGRTVMFNAEIPRQSVTSNFISKFTVKLDSCFPKYLLYCLYFFYQIGLTRRHIKQSTGLQNLDISSYFQERIPFSGLIEQTQITNFLDCKTKQIDELITTEGRKIELLTEYRQSLISEAVTGKIDVRSEV